MKRRDFLRTAAPYVQTSPRVRWRLASSFPNSLDTIFGAAEVLARRVEAMTEGRFVIRPYSANEIVPAFEVLSAVQNGTVQMGHAASYYFKGKNPALVFDCTVPFGLTARQQIAWMYEGGGLELMQELFADFGVISFPGGNTGTQMGGWFRREIGSLTDLRGLKMRIPGFGGEVMNQMGVTVQVLPGGEIYPSLERGAIDATEWVGPYDDEKLGFYQIAKNYYYPGWWEPGPQLSFLINRQAWDALPKDYQEALAAAAAEANGRMLAAYDAKNPPAVARLLAEGVQLRPFPADVMREAERITTELLEAGTGDALYDKIYTAFKQWRASSHRWFATNEMAYARFVYPRG